jgi:hypothetical protein
MPVNTLNNEKTENIKESLAGLLNQLKWEKNKFNEVVEFAGGCFPLPFYFDIDSVNKGITTLEKLKFASIDDFNSVKKLREAELFFLENEGLKKFKFPVYKSHISSDFIKYVEIELQLDSLEKKADDLTHRGHTLAASEAKHMVTLLRCLNHMYFKEKRIGYYDYKSKALDIVNQARPELEQHRGYKEILGNLIFLISTLGAAFIVNKVVNGHFLFFQKTDSAKQLDAISQALAAANQISP